MLKSPYVRLHCAFEDSGVWFSDYPFAPASFMPGGALAFDAIREVILAAAPPEIRTREGEVIFVSAELKEALEKTARKRQLPIVCRVDVWELLLEPFLDTQFSEEMQTRTLAMLESTGIDQKTCAELRRRVERVILKWNSILWDWTHLGLYDLLSAVQHAKCMNESEFREFYWETMEIAERGRLLGERTNN